MSRRQNIFFMILSLFSLFSLQAEAKGWKKFTSDNFSIYSDANTRSVETILTRFEIFRIVAMTQLGLPIQSADDENLIIYIYNSGREFRKTGVNANTAGFFTTSPSGPVMVIGPGNKGIRYQEILFHEYVHHLFFEHSTANYPRWYLEGMADVLSTAEITANEVILGGVPQSRANTIAALGTLDFDDLLTLRAHTDNSTLFEAEFYATSWLLAHYLQINGFYNEPELNEKTRQYLTLFNDGGESLESFASAFGASITDLKIIVTEYGKQRNLPALTWSRPENLGEITVEEISDNEEKYMLANLVWTLGEEDNALEYLEAPQPGQDYFAEMYSLKAKLENHQQNETAVTFADSALKAAPENPEVLANLAHFERDRFENALQKQIVLEDALANARLHAEKAIALDEYKGDAYLVLADVHLYENNIQNVVNMLIQGDNLFPYQTVYREQLVRVLLDNERPDLARPFIASLVSAVHSQDQRNLLLTALSQIDEGIPVDPDFFVPEQETEAD